MRLSQRPVKGTARVSFDYCGCGAFSLTWWTRHNICGAVVLRLVVPASQRLRIIRHLTQADTTPRNRGRRRGRAIAAHWSS